MECAEARQLLDAGVAPGSTDPRRAALGFHLSRCAACRAYREHPGDLGLLAALLLESPPPAPPAPLPPPMPRTSRGRARPAQRRYAAWVAAIALLAGLGLVVGRIAVAAYTIQSNLAAMRVTGAPPVVATPALPGVATLPSTPTAPPVRPATGAAPAEAGLATAVAPGLTLSVTALPAIGAGATPVRLPAIDGRPIPTLPAISATPVRLPAIGGQPLPTLMPTVPVRPIPREPLNILLLGSDRRPGESWQTRSDAIVVVRLDPARQRIALLSIPRDLVVNIPGYGYARINAATVYGESDPYFGGGMELARATVSELLGLPIHHVVRADFSAFIAAIDAIGGVDVVVEQELYDPAYPTMDYGYMVAHFLPGPYHMDGETALIYSRMRHMDSNYARNRRQQQVLVAAFQRVREQNLIGQVEMLADLTTALRDHIQTDLSVEQMIGLAWAFRNVAPEMIERYAIDENRVYEGAIPGDPYATLPLPGAVETVVAQFVQGGE
ncbi:MAG: LCP family protein [Oscillochloridaceae bacterium]|nr:LCP family protein [Oscillochloridaceae bacterium]